MYNMPVFICGEGVLFIIKLTSEHNCQRSILRQIASDITKIVNYIFGGIDTDELVFF